MVTTQAPDPKRGRGRPREGTPVHIRVPDDVLAEIDQQATERGTTRAAEIRRRLTTR